MSQDREVLERMAEDVAYELEQLRRAARLLREGPLAPDEKQNWLISEAGLTHARCLMEFLFQREAAEQPEAVKATWYSPEWEPYEQRWMFSRHFGGTPYSELAMRVNVRILHISTRRRHVERAHLDAYAEAIDHVWTEFHAVLPKPWSNILPR